MGGTTWMKNLIGRIHGYFSRETPMPKEVGINWDICDSAFSKTPRHGYSLFKTHLRPSQENVDVLFRNGVEKVLVTYRDLRDIPVSRYYRHLEFPKDPSESNYADYRTMPKEQALDHSIEEVRREYVPWATGWHAMAQKYPGRFHFATFEDLKRDTAGTFRMVLAFYGIELPDELILQIVEEARGRGTMKDNMAAARILPWAVSSNFRAGKSGNWPEEYSSEQIERCKEYFGQALIELGYERDLNW